MPIELLMQEARGMSDTDIMVLVRFARLLKFDGDSAAGAVSQNPRKKYREAGALRGQGWMAEDFDAPLEDFEL